jgi:hypothetical protein
MKPMIHNLLDHWIVNSEARGMTHNDLHRIMLDSKSMTLRIIDYGRITLPSVQVANYRQSRMLLTRCTPVP